jgi:tetratricopeptide (TPR) repeat protein/transcriptional regulator with XRE-family HTH domain
MFGDVLRAHRLAARLTQEQLAERAGLSTRTVSDLERGRNHSPRQPSLFLLSEALGLAGPERERFEQSGREEYWRRRRDDREEPDAEVEEAADGGPRAVVDGQSAGPATEVAAVTPAQLPAGAAHFAGRAAALHRLDGFLPVAVGGKTTTVVITAISGTAGVGKTALAVHWAHRVAARFPDGQLYVNLRGFDPGGSVLGAREAVGVFLDALGVPPQRVPTSFEAQVGLYRSLLAGRRMLVVLDNARDAEHVRPLLPGSPGCLVVVTSRSELTSLVVVEGAHPLTIDLLSAAEARELLVRRLGSGRIAAERAATEEIILTCAGLPLALAIVAARAATHPGFPLTTLAAELRDAGGLGPLSGGDATADVRAVLSWSYRTLGPAAARLFRLLGLHPGPDIATPAAASLAGIPVEQVRPLLAELAGAHLATEHAPGRYTFHDLLRLYASELANSIDTGAERHGAVHRVLDHYLRAAHNAAVLLNPQRDPIGPVPPRPLVTSEEPADHEQALAWFATECCVLLAAVDRAAAAGFDSHAGRLAWTLVDFLKRRGHWHEWATTQHTALAAAQRLGDREAQAEAHRNLGRIHYRLGSFDDAYRHLYQAVDLFGQVGNHVGQANAHFALAGAFGRQERHKEALGHAELAFELFQSAGHRIGQADVANTIGWNAAHLGDYQRALTQCEYALALHRELGDREGEAHTWDSLGYAHHHLGHHRRAVACYQRALDLYLDLSDRKGEAETLTRLGDAHHAAGNPVATRNAWQHALDTLDDLGHSDAAQVRAKLERLASSPASTARIPVGRVT